MTVRITTEHGVDVTEGVQASYDLLLNSLDWGSGFLTIEEIEPLARLAIAAGYDTQPIAEYLAWHVGRRYMPAEEKEEALKAALAQIEALRQEMRQA